MGRVVPHTGDVGRNFNFFLGRHFFRVVPHTGDVGRNMIRPSTN